MDLKKLNLLGNWVLLQKDQSNRFKTLFVTESFKRASPMAKIMRVGPGVPDVFRAGDYVLHRANNRWIKAHSVTDDDSGCKCYIAPWDSLLGRIFDGKVWPIGRKVLVKRIMSDHNISNLIRFRNYDKLLTQSLEVEVIRLGLTLPKQEFKTNGLKPGMKARLLRWEHHMEEVGILGEYHLIVNEDDLLFERI